jgi:ABC-type lipoprotein export system ATPase subunit
MALFQEIYASRGITILLVTHATELVRYGTRSLRMAGGKIVADAVA